MDRRAQVKAESGELASARAPPCGSRSGDDLMLKGTLFAIAIVAALYLAGVTPSGVKAAIERQRQEHATVSAFSDNRGDWG